MWGSSCRSHCCADTLCGAALCPQPFGPPPRSAPSFRPRGRPSPARRPADPRAHGSAPPDPVPSRGRPVPGPFCLPLRRLDGLGLLRPSDPVTWWRCGPAAVRGAAQLSGPGGTSTVRPSHVPAGRPCDRASVWLSGLPAWPGLRSCEAPRSCGAAPAFRRADLSAGDARSAARGARLPARRPGGFPARRPAGPPAWRPRGVGPCGPVALCHCGPPAWRPRGLAALWPCGPAPPRLPGPPAWRCPGLRSGRRPGVAASARRPAAVALPVRRGSPPPEAEPPRGQGRIPAGAARLPWASGERPHRETPVQPVVDLWQTSPVLSFAMIIGSSAPVRSDR
ncbi:hypothetical protein RKD22_005359 [Streptomyces pristinaespiralis]